MENNNNNNTKLNPYFVTGLTDAEECFLILAQKIIKVNLRFILV